MSVSALENTLRRLDNRVRYWSPTRWRGHGVDGRPRSEIAYKLAVVLADLARQAGNGAPDVVVPQLAVHGIADQLAVLGRELLDAPQAAAHAEAGAAACARTNAIL